MNKHSPLPPISRPAHAPVRSGPGAFLAVALILLFTVLTISRNALWNDSRVLWQDVIAQSPRKSNGYSNLGILFAREKRYSEALALLQQAVLLDPENVEARYNLGSLFRILGRYEEALRELQAAISLRPDLPEAYGGVVDLYLDQGDTLRARAYLEDVIRRGVHSFPLQLRLAILYAQTGRVIEAEKVLHELLAERPWDSAALSSMGSLLLEQKRYSEALAYYERALHASPVEPQLYYNIALTLDALGRNRDAVPYYREFLMRAPQADDGVIRAVRQRIGEFYDR